MGFLGKIGKFVSGVADKFLNKIVDTGTDKASDWVFGEDGNPVLTPEQNAQAQANLDYNNPNDIRRHNAFLMGTADTEGQAYAARTHWTRGADRANQIQDLQQITPVKAEMDKQYMDTVYSGTSPWERLGSNAAPSLQAPAPDKGPSGNAASGQAFLGALTPLATAKMQADTAKDVARIQGENQENIAKINQSTELQKLSVQTQDGALPMAQLAESKARRLLALAQEGQAHASASSTRNKEVLDTVAQLLALLPQEQIDLEIYKRSEKQGWRELAGLLGSRNTTQLEPADVAKAIEGMSKEARSQITNDTLEIAGALLKGGKAIGGLANSVSKFLPKLGKKPPHGAKGMYFY